MSAQGHGPALHGTGPVETDRFLCRCVQQSTVTDPTETTRRETDGRADYERWLLVAGVSLVSASLAAYEIVPASVTPLVRASLDVSESAAGLIVGSMFGTAVVGSLPAGAVLDRTDSRIAVLAAVVLTLAVGAWGWIAAEQGAYWSLLASRVVGGVAYVVVWNAGIDIVSNAASEQWRATAVGVFTASGPLGFALGQGAGPWVAAQFGWPAVFLASTWISLAGLAVFWPTSRGYGRTDAAAPTLAEFGRVLRARRVWLVGALGFLGYALYLFVNSWAPSYLTEELGLPLATSGLLTALFPAVGLLSRVSGGGLSDWLFDGRRRPVLLASFVAAVPFLATFAVVRSVAVLAAALLGAGFAIQLTLGLSYAYVRELVDARVAATAVAFLTSLGLAGAFVAPIAGGALVSAVGYSSAFLVAGAVAVVGGVVAWVAPES